MMVKNLRDDRGPLDKQISNTIILFANSQKNAKKCKKSQILAFAKNFVCYSLLIKALVE